jgi:hypothetical protein
LAWKKRRQRLKGFDMQEESSPEMGKVAGLLKKLSMDKQVQS